MRPKADGSSARTDDLEAVNWEHEVASQELRAKLADAQIGQQKLDTDKARLTKQLTVAQQASETHRLDLERASASLAEERSKFETSLAQMRKNNAGLLRERSDLQGAIEGLKGELEGAKKHGEMRRAVSGASTLSAVAGTDRAHGIDPDKDVKGDDDVFGTSNRRRTGEAPLPASPGDFFSDTDGDSLAGSPARPRGMGSNLGQATEIDALRHALAHARRTITTLRSAVDKDKEARIRNKRTRADSEAEDDWEPIEQDGSPTKVSARSPGARSRAGRGRRGGFRGTPSKLSRQIDGSDGDRSEFDPDDANDSIVELPSGGGDVIIDADQSLGDGMDPEFATVVDRAREQSLVGDNDSPDTRRLSSGAFSVASGILPDDIAAELARPTFANASTMTDPLPAPPPVIVEVERKIEVPVEKVVEVKVDRIVDRIVEKIVEVPIERVVEKRVEVPVERIVERRVEVPIEVEKIVEVERRVEVPVDRIIEVPVEKTVQERLEVPVDRIVEVEKIVERRVEVPVERVVEKVVEKRVEIPVERIVEVTVEKIVERIKEVPVDRVVEIIKRVEVPVDRIIEVPATLPLKVTAEKGTQVTGTALADQSSQTDVSTGVERGVATDTVEDRPQAPATLYIGSLEPSPSAVIARAIRVPASQLRKVPSQPELHHRRPSEVESETEMYSADEGQTDAEDFEDARETIASIVTSASAPVNQLDPNLRHVRMTPSKTDDLEIITLPDRSPAMEAGVQTMPVAVQDVHDFRRISTNTFGKAGRRSSAFTDTSDADMTVQPIDTEPHCLEVAGENGSSLQPSERPDSTFSMYSILTDSTSVPPLPTPRTITDKSKPPVLAPPPPPSVPPPPGLTPRKPTLSNRTVSTSRPSRPTSPLPSDLLQRAQTPSFTSQGSIAARQSAVDKMRRTSYASMPPPAIPRVPATPGLQAKHSFAPSQPSSDDLSQFGTLSMTPSALPAKKTSSTRRRRANTAMSTASSRRKSLDALSLRSRRQSFASDRTSEGGDLPPPAPNLGANAGTSTDPAVIHAITQTMIGEFLHKYTTKAMSKGFSEKRHRRFFWVHPYTKTLYWSTVDPGAAGTNQSSAKSGECILSEDSTFGVV